MFTGNNILYTIQYITSIQSFLFQIEIHPLLKAKLVPEIYDGLFGPVNECLVFNFPFSKALEFF